MHDIDEEGFLSTSGRFRCVDPLVFAGTSHSTRLALAVRIPRSLLAGGEDTDEQRSGESYGRDSTQNWCAPSFVAVLRAAPDDETIINMSGEFKYMEATLVTGGC